MYMEYELGGLTFSIGSLFLLIADTMDWWLNNRVGCFCSGSMIDEYEQKVGYVYGPSNSACGAWKRSENGIAFFISVCGSFLFTLGSILFVPDLPAIAGTPLGIDVIVLGDNLFIAASACFFVGHGWIVYRHGCIDPADESVRAFKFSNWLTDIPAFGRHACASIGGFIFIVGTIYFLPQYDTDETKGVVAASLFVAGSAFFIFVGLFQAYRFYCATTFAYFH